MANFNKIILMGYLTRDPELKYLPVGTAVVNFGIATNHKYKDKTEVCFVDCRCFGARAAAIHKYVGKGDPLLVEGRLTFDQWQDQDGTERSKHRITVENFVFVGSNNQENAQSYQRETNRN